MTLPRPLVALRIRENELLKPYTTFKIGGAARFFADIQNPPNLEQALTFARSEGLDVFVLGGGSNVLISDRGFDGLVVHPVNEGLTVLEEDSASVVLRIQAAETWDRVVAYAVERQWWGIENLSHIPGHAGAALVQNIGAYGHQLSDVFQSAEVAELDTGEIKILRGKDCGLAYRRSIFNATRKGQLFIFSITLKLAKHGQPNVGYPDVKAYFERRGIPRPTLEEIRQAIIAIRDIKFPFPREEKGGNVGSFFKNLLLAEADYERLERNFRRNFSERELERLRELKRKFATADAIKIPTAFLMEACALKARRVGGAQVHERQPLVLLNQGGATARDVLTLARQVRQTIYRKTGMPIDIEPELVGFTAAELAEYLSLDLS